MHASEGGDVGIAGRMPELRSGARRRFFMSLKCFYDAPLADEIRA